MVHRRKSEMISSLWVAVCGPPTRFLASRIASLAGLRVVRDAKLDIFPAQ